VYDEDAGRFIPGVIDVLTLDEDKVAAVTGFLTADILGPASPEDTRNWVSGEEMFRRFGLSVNP